MVLDNIIYLNKNYEFVKGRITTENNIITELSEYEKSDYRGIIPPFTDVHIHGGYGVDIMDANVEDICYLSQKLLKDNVGMWLPTTVARDIDSVINVAKAIKKAQNINTGAEIAGIHIEGPFISKEYKGIMEDKYILPCDTNWFDVLKDILGDMVIRFTIAPENEGAEEFCKYVVDNGGFVSMGHSNATYNQCEVLERVGANSITHIFNAMSSLHHRKENILTYAFNRCEFCEIIADNVHIIPQMLKLAIKILDDRAVLITDALRPMGLGNGNFEFCGTQINIVDNKAINSEGRLAGSILKLKDAIKNVENYIGYENSLKLVCENPAKLINKFDKIGSIEIGKKLWI